jgi:hypothetical protein
MKKLALAFLLIGVSSVSAFAAAVTYTTVGTFSGTGASGATLALGGITLTYNPVNPAASVDPGFIDLGEIRATGSQSPAFTVPGGVQFTLQVDQTSPTIGNVPFPIATVTGTISTTSSLTEIIFTPNTLTIGPATYTVFSPVFVVAPTQSTPAGLGITTIQGEVILPEPASLGLIGASLLGLGILVRRRTKK